MGGETSSLWGDKDLNGQLRAGRTLTVGLEGHLREQFVPTISKRGTVLGGDYLEETNALTMAARGLGPVDFRPLYSVGVCRSG